jgi:hypothetical protein
MTWSTDDSAEPPSYSDEELYGMAAAVLDPFYTEPVPPARSTPAQLRELARQRRRGVARRRWMLGSPLVAAAAVLAVLAASRVLLPGEQPPPAAATQPSTPAVVAPELALGPPAPLGFTEPAPAVPARATLAALATRIGSGATGTPGQYAYLHTRTWTGSPESSGVMRDEWLWWAANRSGRLVSALSPVAAGTARHTVDYRPGQVPVVIDAPSADPPILASQLADFADFASGPQAPLRAVVDMYRFHLLDPAHRAAALRVLADTDGLVYRGEVTDAAGRTGIAVSADSDQGATRDVAVFDQSTGALLSYERVAVVVPPRSSVRAPVVLSMVLFLAAEYVDGLDQPAGAG